ncbi:hypothetical protein [Bradyrhizobium sp. CCBAU 53421]|uniref:hypothetical protein n=1 Tax=Bradyrhizobium sp. CCBAU 53421 TaxID=1325120 RepID=UPI00188C6CEE|nr:hypothetical protein [Bradyrhizobium sp. CCBAU 53421]QOZ36366.1 hypothetical protein XH92_35865 [Bradyrhizobium sp. CCBAU 53421]
MIESSRIIFDLEQRFARLLEGILTAEKYEIVSRDERVFPDLIARALRTKAITVFSLKLYRSERTSFTLLEHAVDGLQQDVKRYGAAYGILVITSILSERQKARVTGLEKIAVWDRVDLTERAKRAGNGAILSLNELLKHMRMDEQTTPSAAIAELVEEIIVTPRRGAELAEKLQASSTGRNKTAAKNFEVLCEQALTLLYGSDFAAWTPQARVDGGFQRIDLVARLVPISPFWVNLAHDFRSRYVIFEFKNYPGAITQSEVYSTEKYLFTSALRSVAVIVARSGFSQSAEKAMNGALREQGKLILCIDLKELCTLLRGYDVGDDPCNLLIQRLDEVLTRISR